VEDAAGLSPALSVNEIRLAGGAVLAPPVKVEQEGVNVTPSIPRLHELPGQSIAWLAHHAGSVVAILSKEEINSFPNGIAVRTAGNESDAVWLSLLSQTSVTQSDRSSTASFATT
jgi:hypothetical protein